MAIFTAHAGFDFAAPWELVPRSQSGSEFVYASGQDRWTLGGEFSYDFDTDLWSGVADQFRGHGGDGPRFSIFDLAFALSELQAGPYTADDYGVLPEERAHLARMLSGADEVIGSGEADVLSGFNGNDVVWGQGGDDTVEGGGGEDSVHGGAGNDLLDGSSGADTLAGGAGDDLLVGTADYILQQTVPYLVEVEDEEGNVYWEEEDQFYFRGETLDGGSGIDTVSFLSVDAAITADLATGLAHRSDLDLSVDVDALHIARAFDGETPADRAGAEQDASTRLLGIENLTGSNFADLLTGNASANVLNGRGGADTMRGGSGNDTYYRSHPGDTIVEGSNGGIDRIIANLTTTLGSNVENLTLSGSAAANGTGNALANDITGNDAANVIDAGAGADTMRGGLGNDTYYRDNAGDSISESANGGLDRVIASVSTSLGNHVEKLTLSGTAAINGTGNTQANTIVGNGAANLIDGGAGADTLVGAGGRDVFVFRTGQSTSSLRDVITDWAAGDKIDLSRVDAREGVAGTNDFTFIGSAAFSSTNATGQLRYNYIAAADKLLLYGSSDADAASEFSVELTGVVRLTAGDFIF